jgi:hypothetical protein
MEKSRLIQVLRSFSKKEFRELRKWLHSPAHNQREDVQLMLEYFLKKDHLSDARALDKEVVFADLFPGEEYDDARIRQTMHFMMKAVEEFLTYSVMMQDQINAQVLLARVYRQRQLDKPFQHAVNQARKLQKKHPFRNRHFLENEYLLQYEDYSYRSGLRRTVQLNLQEVSDALDVSFLSKKLRQSCLMLSHRAVFKTEYDWGLLENLLEFVENHHYLDFPAVAIYYYSYKALSDPSDEASFKRLKKEIFDHDDLFPESEIRDIYLLAINYCIGRMNAGNEAYRRETFELYKNGLEKKILIQNDLLSRWTYKNVVTIGTMLKEFDWVEHFIPAYQQYLEPKYRESMVHYNQAKLHYEKKEYDQAMLLFGQVEYDDILLNLGAKTMLMKMYFELDEYNALDSLLESMSKYVRRKDVIGYHKSNYRNIITYTKKVFNSNPFDQKQRAKLVEEIKTANPLTERKWLLAQMGEGEMEVV